MASGPEGEVADAVARLAWESRVGPLDTAAVEITDGQGVVQRPVRYRFVTDAARYEARWGPRPSS